MTLPDWLELSPDLWRSISLVGVYLGAIVLTAESLYRFSLVDAEISRKVVHIGAGHVILFAWWLQIPAWVGITASILASLVTLISYKYPILPGVNSIGRKSLGTFFYATSIGVLVAWFWGVAQPQFAAIGILVMTWGDGLAALIGQRFGKRIYKIGEMQKSWEGSATMFAVSYGVSCLILLSVYGPILPVWIVPLGVAFIATGLEAFSKLGIDNLTVPVGSAAVAFWFMQLWGY